MISEKLITDKELSPTALKARKKDQKRTNNNRLFQAKSKKNVESYERKSK